MTLALAGIAGSPRIQIEHPDDGYEPGVCNIGPAEIARRRRFGHAALITAVVLFAGLVAIGAPPLLRAIVALPVAVAVACYIEAALKFCIRFGWLGLFNFGAYGSTNQIEDEAARAADRRRSFWLTAGLAAVLVAVAALAILLPI